MSRAALCSIVLIAPAAMMAGDWQVMGGAGFGVYHYLGFRTAAGSAQAGIGSRYALSAAVDRQFGSRFAVEGAYLFQDGDFEISSGSQKTAYDANAHAVHGDLLMYLRRREPALRPYVAGGAGVKVYRGLETPGPRPLGEFGSFAQTDDTRPMVTFGGGVDWAFTSRFGLRLDVRDYATPFPTSVIVPAAGANLSGWLHGLVGTLSITFR